MSFTQRLMIVALMEILFMVATRVILFYLPEVSLQAELLRTGLRIATAAVEWVLLRDLILSRSPRAGSLSNPWLLAAFIMFMAAPLLVGRANLSGPMAWLFALSSVPVAIKEEFLFRGIIQNLLNRRMGTLLAIVLTSLVFVVWHPAFWTRSLFGLVELLVAGMLLGLVYAVSGSILAVIGIHALYDAMYSFTPLFSPPLRSEWGLVPLLLSLAAVCTWAWMCGQKGQTRTL